MKRWQEELTKHPIHTVLQNLREQAEKDLGTIDPVQEIERTRFAKVVRLMQKVIADLDPEIVPLDVLNQINSNLQSHNVMSTMAAFSQSPTLALIQQANTQINANLSYIYQLAGLKSARIVREVDVEVASTSFELFAEATRREFEKVSSATISGVAKVEAMLAEVSSALDRSRQIETSLSAKMSEFEKRSSDSSNQQSGEFSSAQSKRQADFSDLLSQIRNETDQKAKAIFAQTEEEIEANKKSTEKSLDSIIKDARVKHNSILELFQLTAKDSVSGGYESIADREHKAANRWRWVTIGSAIVAIGWVGLSYFYFTPGDESDRVFWIKLAKSVSLTALLLSLAVYASRQSTLHRFNERRARAFSLQVKAFDPFIASLPAEMQHKLKEEMSKRIFSPEEQEGQPSANNVDFESLDKGSLLQIISLLIGKKP